MNSPPNLSTPEPEKSSEPTYQQTVEALDDSISHWERIESGTTMPGEGIFSFSCPLCELFMHDHATIQSCLGCPVRQKTGKPTCQDTPWFDVYMAYCDVHSLEKIRPAAKIELEFLRELRAELTRVGSVSEITRMNGPF